MNRRHFLAAAGAAAVLPAGVRAERVQGLIIHPRPLPLPALDLRDGDGQPFALGGLAPRPVLVNLWATWCLPCVIELPSLDRLKRAAPGGLAVVAVSFDRRGRDAVRPAYARLGITALEVVVDAGNAGEVLGIPALPTTLLLGADGAERARLVGPVEWDGPQAAPLVTALAAGRALDPAMAPPPLKATGAAP